MKKYAVLLLLVLCLSLTACRLPFELPFDLPFYNSSEEQSQDYTALYVILEDNAFPAAMDMLYEMQKGNPSGNSAVSGLSADMVEKLAQKYAQLQSALEQNAYVSAAEQIAKLAYDYLLQQTGKQIHEQLSGWFERIENSGYEKHSFLSFYEEGRFSWTRSDETMFWVIREIDGTYIDITVYYGDTLQTAGSARIQMGSDERSMQFTHISRSGEEYMLDYVCNWLFTGAYNGKWQTPDENEEFPVSFSVEGRKVVVDDTCYSMSMDPYGEVMLCAEDGTKVYTLRLCMDEQYDYIQMENHWTSCDYYSGDEYAQKQMIYEYEKALHILSILENTDGELDYNGDCRSRQEWFAYIRQAMINANGYGESTRILSNFTVVEGLLIDITTEPDNLNGHVQPYEYDNQGRLIYARDESFTLFIYGTPELMLPVAGYEDYYETMPHQYHFEYDWRGRISRITHMNWEKVISVITPTYNTAGNIKRLDIAMANGESRVANFTYDSDMMPRTMGSDLFLSDTDVLRSISYGDYFLEFAWTPDPDGYILSGIAGWISLHGQDTNYTEEYTYENGLLTSRTVTAAWCEGAYSTTDVYLYSYDDAGRLASHHITTTSGENSWKNTLYYVYRDVLFYNYEIPEDPEHGAAIQAYQKALEILPLLENCGGILTFEGETKTQQEWLAYVRQAMIDADGYGESSQILSNFTRLENVLVGVSTDPNGGSYVKEYRYDAAGRMIFANDDFYTMYLYYTLELPITPHYYFEYDDENRVSRIIHKNGEELYATITLTYNDRGQVRRMDIRMADGEERFATFAYSMDMMPHTLNSELWEDEEWEEEWGEEPEEGAFDVLISISYGEMFMDFAWTPDFDGYTYSGMNAWFPVNEDEGIAYSEHVDYDDQDRRIKKTVWLDDVVSTVCTYAYDAAGNLISETHTDANGQSVTYYYIYETVLVYDFTA